MTTRPGFLSGSTNGRPIKVAATATPGTLLHTAVAGPTDADEITLWACNTDTVDRLLTLEVGGVTAPDDHVQVTIPAESGLVEVLPGVRLRAGLVLRAFAAAANVVTVVGRVERISEVIR